MKDILALSILMLLAIPAAAETKWENDNTWTGKNWRIYGFMGCSLYYQAHFGNYEDDWAKGFEGLEMDLYPLKFNKPDLHVSHESYKPFEIGGTVNGSIGFDGNPPKKLKFKLIELKNSSQYSKTLTIENFDLNILRSMAVSDTMEIKVDKAETATIPLEGIKEAYEVLHECFTRARDRGWE
jgi:hypothetical protein